MSLFSLLSKAVEKQQNDGFISLFSEGPSWLYHQYLRRKIEPYLWTYTHQLNGYKAVADPFKIVRISPNRIQRYETKFGKRESIGQISGGTWDIDALELTKNKKYQAVQAHFCEGISWEETGIIDHLHNKMVEEDRTIDGCETKVDLEARYERVDSLYKSMKENGYQEQKHGSQDYVAVQIARDGEFLFAGSGHHRLFIAKILELDEIPVWIRTRHKEWQEIREEVRDSQSVDELSKEARNCISHPDLQEFVDDDWL